MSNKLFFCSLEAPLEEEPALLPTNMPSSARVDLDLYILAFFILFNPFSKETYPLHTPPLLPTRDLSSKFPASSSPAVCTYIFSQDLCLSSSYPPSSQVF